MKHGIELETLARTWRKSSRSGGNNNCVEMAELSHGGVLVADTKDPNQAPLTVSRAAFGRFIAGIKAGQL